MQLNIELTDEYASKLAYLLQKTDQQDVKAMIEAAIDVYYQQLEAAPRSALEIFQTSGFIGCIQADADQSINYKSTVSAAIQERFQRSQDE